MADVKQKAGTANQAITITLASLADGSFRQSAAIDNSSNLFLDVLVGGKITTGTSPTANKQLLVYLYGTVDGGTLYSGNASGSDAAYSPSNNEEQNLILCDIIGTDNANNISYEFGPISVRRHFGFVPDSWGIVVKNETGATLNATGGNHDINYQGFHRQIV